MKSGNLNFLEPCGPLQACNGTALPLPLLRIFRDGAGNDFLQLTDTRRTWETRALCAEVLLVRKKSRRPEFLLSDRPHCKDYFGAHRPLPCRTSRNPLYGFRYAYGDRGGHNILFIILSPTSQSKTHKRFLLSYTHIQISISYAYKHMAIISVTVQLWI